MAELMRIGELAAAAGVSNRTVDFYTNLGLISPVQRTEGGFRLYDPAIADVIATIRQLEASGLALDDIVRGLDNAVAGDLADMVHRIDRDLEALRTLAESAGSNTHGLVTTLVVRAHNLLVAAMELLSARPDL